MNPSATFHNPLSVTTLYPQYTGSKITALTPTHLALYPPSSYELTLLRFRAFKLMQQKAMLAQQEINDIKQEYGLKSEESTAKIESGVKTEVFQEQITQLTPIQAVSCGQELVGKELKTEIRRLLRFLLTNMGKDNESFLDDARSYYTQNQALLEVYDRVRMKYYSAKKCKEDIIRYILRKAFRSIRISIMKEQKICSKKASLILCKRHFYHRAEQLGDPEKFENEDDLLESLMPFNKNSKNKTMNLNFVLEIFTSQSFCEEYQKFLPEFNRVVVDEHKKKEEKLVSVLLSCVQKNNFSELKNLSRLPWTDVWIEDAKNIAIGIMPNKRLVYNYKKPKV